MQKIFVENKPNLNLPELRTSSYSLLNGEITLFIKVVAA
jgi:hypothetical protein